MLSQQMLPRAFVSLDAVDGGLHLAARWVGDPHDPEGRLSARVKDSNQISRPHFAVELPEQRSAPADVARACGLEEAVSLSVDAPDLQGEVNLYTRLAPP